MNNKQRFTRESVKIISFYSKVTSTHSLKAHDAWRSFREVRHLLRTKIKQARKSSSNKALSLTRPKEIWRTIYRILNPSPQPLRLDVNELTNFFTSTPERITGNSELAFKEDLINIVHSLHLTTSNHDSFQLRGVTVTQVLREIKGTRSDTSTGPEQVPAKYLKLVAEHVAGLRHAHHKLL